jgi:hypothetical protein
MEEGMVANRHLRPLVHRSNNKQDVHIIYNHLLPNI